LNRELGSPGASIPAVDENFVFEIRKAFIGILNIAAGWTAQNVDGELDTGEDVEDVGLGTARVVGVRCHDSLYADYRQVPFAADGGRVRRSSQREHR
jgi:hypothetical protein